MGRQIKNLSSKTFGLWEVQGFSYIDKKSGNAYWVCQCRGCGGIYDVRSDGLQSGRSTQCRKCAHLARRYGHARTI